MPFVLFVSVGRQKAIATNKLHRRKKGAACCFVEGEYALLFPLTSCGRRFINASGYCRKGPTHGQRHLSPVWVIVIVEACFFDVHRSVLVTSQQQQPSPFLPRCSEAVCPFSSSTPKWDDNHTTAHPRRTSWVNASTTSSTLATLLKKQSTNTKQETAVGLS